MENSNGKKLCKSASGLRMLPSAEEFASPFAIQEPMWSPDSECAACLSCKKKFDILNRRHHCRRCGHCFCSRCCDHRIMLQRMYFVDPVRHCYDCAVLSKQEQEFYGKGLAVLFAGENFEVENAEDSAEFLCKLSQDTRHIVFSSPRGTPSAALPSPILLTKITNAKIVTKNINNQELALGVTISYKDETDSSKLHEVSMQSCVQKQSSPWIICLQNALKLLFESRNA